MALIDNFSNQSNYDGSHIIFKNHCMLYGYDQCNLDMFSGTELHSISYSHKQKMCLEEGIKQFNKYKLNHNLLNAHKNIKKVMNYNKLIGANITNSTRQASIISNRYHQMYTDHRHFTLSCTFSTCFWPSLANLGLLLAYYLLNMMVEQAPI
jgi:hypothetical protein